MCRRMPTRRRRRLQALLLATVAVAMVVVEPFPKGKVLLSITPTHGVDVGDLPAVALLLVAVPFRPVPDSRASGPASTARSTSTLRRLRLRWDANADLQLTRTRGPPNP
jgi:hypothetical protein